MNDKIIIFDTLVHALDLIPPEQLPAYAIPDEDEMAEILYTTGTTGKSKGIMISHGANVALGQNISMGVQMGRGNIDLVPVPLSHSYGLRSVYASLYNGSSAVILDGLRNPKNFFSAIDQYHITSLTLVPAIINILLALSKGRLSQYAARIEFVQSGSAALSEQTKIRLIELLPQSRLYNFYGSTESGRCCVHEYSKDPEKIGCIGLPAHNASFKIIDDAGETLPSFPKYVGRLACKGKMNMLGYWKAATETEAIMRDGYIITNDLCFIDDQYIYYVGRQGDVMNVGGKKVSPLEVEEAANMFMDVKESICVPLRDPLLGQVPRLLIVLNEGTVFRPKELASHLAEQLEDYKLPKKIDVIDQVPRMYNGKIDRKTAQSL